MSGQEKSTKSVLKNCAMNLGADLFGIADLSEAQDFICAQGGDYLGRFQRGISVGIHLLDGIVDGLMRHEDPVSIYTYRGLYNSVNLRLDQIALSLAKIIQNEKYVTYVIPASQTIDNSKLVGAISHKLVANLSGLGWIGKNCLLITPEYGPRVRWATILTDSPLKAGKTIKNECGKCKECVDICPVKAFTGVPFNPSEPREVRFKAHSCRAYSRRREERMGEGLCGLCVYICPYGKKLLNE